MLSEDRRAGRSPRHFSQSSRASSAASFAGAPPRVAPLYRTTQIAYVGLVVAAIGYSIFLLQPSNRGSTLPWLALVFADLFVLLRATGTAWTILAGDRLAERPDVISRREQLRAGINVPSTDVLIPVYGESLDLIERTAVAARDMLLPHRTIICDDADDPDVAELAARLGVEYRSRPDNIGAKAGNINAALADTTGEFVALFDADMEPHPEFLVYCVANFVDPKLAFVQTPQTYWNDNTFIARGAARSQRVFYELISPGMNAFDSMFHVGTNALFRRAALEDVGGLYASSNSEDIWTSFKMHEAGWSSYFSSYSLARGLAPDRLEPFLRQQTRWATGAFEILLKARPYLSRKLTLDQRFQYTIAPLHFAQSIPILWFTALPPLFLLFGIEPLAVDGSTWLLRYLPFWFLMNAVVYLQIGGTNISAMAISIVSAPSHIRALFQVFFGRSTGWNVTNRPGRHTSIIDLMPVQLSLAVLNATGFIVGIAVLKDPSVSIVALALCAFHVGLIGRVALAERNARTQTPASELEPPQPKSDIGERASAGPKLTSLSGERG